MLLIIQIMSNYTKYTKYTKLILYKSQTLLKTSNLTNHNNRLYTIITIIHTNFTKYTGKILIIHDYTNQTRVKHV